MTLKEAIQKLNELEIKFEGLKETMVVFQESINNSINWFIAALGIFVTLLGVVGVALYFIVQTAINKGVEKGISKVNSVVQTEISQIKTEFNEFKNGLDQHVIQLIKNNPYIKWSSGMISFSEKFYIGGLNGNIDWDSQVTNIRLVDYSSKKPIPFETARKEDGGFELKILNGVKAENLEWSIVWVDKK